MVRCLFIFNDSYGISRQNSITAKTVAIHSLPEWFAVYLSSKIVVMSPRPGRIIDVIENTLPTKRPLEIRDSKEFITVSQRVREGLRSGHSYE